MSTYAIGDIQGCYLSLMGILERIEFDSSRDRLWLVGDLVNRGPRSLDVLRWASRESRAITTVLGNHDIYLLARTLGGAPQKRWDTLDDVLAASDRDALIGWLRRQPLAVRDADSRHLLVHAGLHPSWTTEEADDLAGEAAEALQGRDAAGLLASLALAPPPPWSPSLRGRERVLAILAVLTRLRVCTPSGVPDYDFTGRPESAPAGYLPWFAVPGRRSAGDTVVFGHWASLGLVIEADLVGLDSGCVYANALTAIRLEDRTIFQHPCVDH